MTLVLAVVLSACKRSKDLVKDENIPARKTSVIIDSVDAMALSCEWISMKHEVEFKSKKLNDSFKMYVRMRKDSAIWVSATYYAVEVARFLFTPDSVKYMDRKNNKFFEGEYDFISDQFNLELDFITLQAILLANSLPLSDADEKIRSSRDKGMYQLSFLRKGQLRRALRKDDPRKPLDLAISYWVDPESFRVRETRLYDFEASRELIASYSKFETECNSLFPKTSEYILVDGNEQTVVNTTILKFTEGKKVSLSFTIPDKYEPYFP